MTKKLKYCPKCDKPNIKVITRPETFRIRGMDITVDINLYHCDDCGSEFSSKDIGDPFRKAYDKYFELTGEKIEAKHDI